MQELIPINLNQNQEPVVSGRELYDLLGIKTPYKKWFDRMCEYGFNENLDFVTVGQKCPIANGGYQDKTDHAIKLDMAKEISMLQRNEQGKKVRQYFIEVEKEYNSPEKIMARALRIAENTINNLTLENKQQKQLIAEFEPKVTYHDLVLQTPDVLSVSQIAKDYGKSAMWLNKMLKDLGVQYQQGGVWLLYQKYAELGLTKSKTSTYADNDGKQHSKIHTYWTQKGRLFIYDLLKQNGNLPLIER